ncbi:hypothetical protein C8R45DRAFT_948126 [Mycena sanguinolenta]|nr:hypothetical protein C8R45DRAFT_948126 [Mycena sanguinolenta]
MRNTFGATYKLQNLSFEPKVDQRQWPNYRIWKVAMLWLCLANGASRSLMVKYSSTPVPAIEGFNQHSTTIASNVSHSASPTLTPYHGTDAPRSILSLIAAPAGDEDPKTNDTSKALESISITFSQHCTNGLVPPQTIPWRTIRRFRWNHHSRQQAATVYPPPTSGPDAPIALNLEQKRFTESIAVVHTTHLKWRRSVAAIHSTFIPEWLQIGEKFIFRRVVFAGQGNPMLTDSRESATLLTDPQYEFLWHWMSLI